MPASDSYEVRSLDHPERRVVVHLEVVEREVLDTLAHRILELEAQAVGLKAAENIRLTAENVQLRKGLRRWVA